MFMKFAHLLVRLIGSRAKPQEFVDFSVEVGLPILKKLPPHQRVDFYKNVSQKHLGELLVDLSREDRAALMNGLMPLFAREFPLDQLDLLAAFASPGNQYAPEGLNQQDGNDISSSLQDTK